MASQSKNTLPIAVVFSNLFRNFPRLILTNLIFAVPLAAVFFLLRLLVSALGLDYNAALFVQLLTVIFVFPFYAGVVKITSKMAVGEEKVGIFRNFFSAVKENFFRFLIHGAVLYVAVVFSYVSLSLYINLLSQNSAFLGALIVSIIVAVFFLFMFFYIPSMTVTFDLPMRAVYKNSLLMSYGELKKNFIGLFGLFCVAVISMTFLMACYGSRLAVVIVTIALVALLLPSVSSFIINAAVYERMCAIVTDNTVQAQKINEKINSVKQRQGAESGADFKERLKNFVIDEKLSDDEYVYFDGRMVKKGALVKMKKEALESEDN